MAPETNPVSRKDGVALSGAAKEGLNPFASSTVTEKLRAQQLDSPIILMVDLDSTFEDPNPANKPSVPEKIRAICEALSIPVIAVTSRTEEMTFSSEDYEKTRNAGQIARPMARLKQVLGENGLRRFEPAPPETLDSYRGQLSFDAVAAQTGTVIYVRQSTGEYLKDRDYERGMDSEKWRSDVLEIVNKLIIDPENGEKLSTLSAIEDPKNYEAGEADVWPPDWRIQLDFKAENTHPSATGATDSGSGGVALTSEQAVAKKQEFLRRVNEYAAGKPLPFNVLDDSNPQEGRATVYILRRRASKERAINRMLGNIAADLGRVQTELSPICTGDSFTDLRDLIALHNNENAVLLLVGDSRLTPVIEKAIRDKDADPRFADERLRKLLKRLRTIAKGVHRLGNGPTLITGEKFEGTSRAETILAYLLEKFKNLPDGGQAYKKAQSVLELPMMPK